MSILKLSTVVAQARDPVIHQSGFFPSAGTGGELGFKVRLTKPIYMDQQGNFIDSVDSAYSMVGENAEGTVVGMTNDLYQIQFANEERVWIPISSTEEIIEGRRANYESDIPTVITDDDVALAQDVLAALTAVAKDAPSGSEIYSHMAHDIQERLDEGKEGDPEVFFHELEAVYDQLGKAGLADDELTVDIYSRLDALFGVIEVKGHIKPISFILA